MKIKFDFNTKQDQDWLSLNHVFEDLMSGALERPKKATESLSGC